MTEQEVDIYSFTLSIQSIKMKIKFPCKMTIEHKNVPITNDVSPNDFNKFIFNKQITISQDDGRQLIELTANLNTDKGAKYIAGVIKLHQAQLIKQQGEVLVIQLSKCLDPEATCELRVDQVASQKMRIKVPAQKSQRGSRVRMNVDSHLSPGHDIHFGTKSEYNFPVTNTKNKRQWDQYKSRQGGFNASYTKKSGFKRGSNFVATYAERNTPQFQLDSQNRDKLIQAQVYKEGYHKLKDKYKRQAQTAKHQLNKRMALENNQNNFKLEIMRLKLRCDEQERAVNEKNARIKELQIQVGNLQKKELDLQYLKEEMSNKEHMIKMLEDTIRTLNKDNEDLKNLNKDRFESDQAKMREIRNELQMMKVKFENKELQYDRQVKQKGELINQRDMEIKVKQDHLEREKKLVDELEKAAQNKIYEFQRTLQNEKNIWKGKLDEMKAKMDKIEKQKEKVEQDLKDAKTELDKAKNSIIKLEYEKKILTQEGNNLKTEIKQLKTIKEKHGQLTREHRLLNEDKDHLQKQLQRSINNRQASIAELTKQYQEQLQYYKKIFKDVDEKLKVSQAKNVQLESQMEQKKNEIDKMKRNQDSLQKQNNELKEKENYLTKMIKGRDEELNTMNVEMNSIQHKYKSGDQLMRLQLQKAKEQFNKLKMENEGQLMKNSQINENNMNLNIELNKSKLEHQSLQEKYERQSNAFKERLMQLERNLKDKEEKIQELNSEIHGLRLGEKESLGKIQKFQIQILQINEKWSKAQKELKITEEKLSSAENVGRNKQEEINGLQSAKQNLSKKIQEHEQKLSKAKNTINVLNGQKNKNEKIISVLQSEIEEGKRQIEKLKEVNSNKEKVEEELRSQIKKNKEENLKLQMRLSALKKQYEKFKESVLETLVNTYTQIPLGNDHKTSTISFDYSRKRDSEVNIDGGDIINIINSQNKELKMATTKMIEQSKYHQGQIEKLKIEMLQNGSKFEQEEEHFQNIISDLQDELRRTYEEKEESEIKNQGKINELHQKLDEEENMVKELMVRIEELNFTINSLKLDHDSNNEHFNIKYAQYKNKVYELEEKIRYLTEQLEKQEIRSHDFEERSNTTNITLEKQKQISIKRQKQIDELVQEKEELSKLLEDYKKSKKELNEKISEYEFKLNTQMQVSTKTKMLLEDEERKGVELKNFINELMKQKQTIIKSDLEKSEQIINLQTEIVELTREKESLEEENERDKGVMEEQKETIKKMNQSNKDLEGQLLEEKSKEGKISEKLKQKEKEVLQQDEVITRLEQRVKEQAQKMQKETAELQSQLDDHRFVHNKVINQMNDKVFDLEKAIEEGQSTIEKNKKQIASAEENLFSERRNNEIKSEQIMKLEDQMIELKAKIDSLQLAVNNSGEELKEKEESMFQLSGKIYNLQVKLQKKQEQMTEKINSMNEDWGIKYDSVCEEYEERLQLVEKDKNYHKLRFQEKEEELKKCLIRIKDGQIEDSNLKKILQEKIKRLEDERLSIISTKNNEIQKLSEENKTYFDSIKTKEADIRRLHHQLQIARSTIGKLDFHDKEKQEKIKNINKIYQTELQQLRRKDAAYRNTKQAINKCQWNIEREVKKLIGGYLKKAISGAEEEETNRIMQNTRTLEQNLITTISSKIQEVK